MDRHVTNEKEAYFSMTKRYVYKNHMLDVILPISKIRFKEKEVKFLILINKHFSSYKLKQYSIEHNWEDFILHSEKFTIDWGINHVHIQLPFFYNIEEDIHVTNFSENGASITIDVDHADQEVCILAFRPNVFTNRNYVEIYRNENWDKIWIDQTKSATLNRKRISNFLEELETVLETEITEVTSSYINNEHLYKYGIKEEAELEL